MIYKSNSRRTLDCIVMAGQSNETGGTAEGIIPGTYLVSQPYSMIYYKPDATTTNNGTLQSLLFGLNQNWNSAWITYCGPEISFGYAYNQSTGNPVVIIKYAYGGSGLVDDGVDTNINGLWQIDANPTRANNLLHYTTLINNFVIPCIQKCKSNGIDLNIKALHWCQGEADSKILACANDYQTQLTRLINQFTLDLSSYNVISPNFIPIITRTNINISPVTYPYLSTVRTAQSNVASNFNGYMISSDGYTLASDNLHYTRASQVTHGNDVNTKYQLIL